MSEPSNKELKKAIQAAVVEAGDEPIGLKALTKKLESDFELPKGGLKDKKDHIKKYLMEALEEEDEESSSEEEVMPRKGTVNANRASQVVEPEARKRAGTENKVTVQDGEYSDKTAGKSRAGQTPDHAGFLKKRGDQGRIKLWRKRHFRLYRKEGVIAYFKSETDEDQIGEVSVIGAFLVDKREDLGKNIFTVTMKTTARVWILQADTEQIMNEWIDLCKPLMKETAAIRPSDGGKKPPKPANGLPLPFPPTYVQGFGEREGSVTALQDHSDLDWTKLTHQEAAPVALTAGQVAISLHGKTAVVEEVREVAINAGGQGYVHDVPKQLKYNMGTVGWSSQDANLQQAVYLHDEKTQRDLLRKLVGRTITASVPGTGAGHGEDHGKKQETRKGSSPHAGGKEGSSLTFPNDATFTGKLYFDEKDERYALVDEASNTVHFLNTRDARTIKVSDANVKKITEGTEDTFGYSRLQLQFAPGPSKTLGQLSYRLRDLIDTHINYVVVLGADEKTADVQGWYSFENRSSKTFENAVITVAPNPKAKPIIVDESEETLEDVVAAEATKAATKKIGGGLAAIGGFLKKGLGIETEVAAPKEHRYPVAQNVTLPAYDWAHAAFVSQQVPVATQHLVRFTLPEYSVKPQCDQGAGSDATAEIFSVTRFSNPLSSAIPAGVATVSRRNRNGLGSVRVASSAEVPRAEAGEEVILKLEKLAGVSATRKQTGYNFDGEKHFIIETFEIVVANSRNETIELTIEESLFRWSNIEIPSSKPAHESTSHPRKIQWHVRLNSGEDQTIKYTAFYSTFELPSDYEQN